MCIGARWHVCAIWVHAPLPTAQRPKRARPGAYGVVGPRWLGQAAGGRSPRALFL